MDARAFIRVKRDQGRHRPDEIRDFVAGCLGREIADYQLSAWLMRRSSMDSIATKPGR